MRYKTNVALSVKGDRVERGAVIELTDEEAANLDAADIEVYEAVEANEPQAPVETPIEEMSVPQLKERAKELGLSASGSKADLQERIALHLQEATEPQGD